VKEQIIQLEAHDDIVSVRDKLGWIRAPRVLLVFPADRRSRILQDRLDLVLLQREVTRRKAQLALITRDPVVIEHARDLGIPTFKSVEASHARFWRTERAQLQVSREEQPVPLEPDLAEAGSRLRDPAPLIPPAMQRALGIAVLILSALLALAAAIIVVPGVTIRLVPASNQVTVSTTIVADPALEQPQPGSTTIAARMVGVEVAGSTSVEATGTILVPMEKARGLVVFTNLIPDQVTIPRGTVVRTSAAQPVRFATLEDATLPGRIGGSVEVAVEAVEAGFEGNLPGERINQIEGPLSARIGVTNDQPTRGGTAEEVTAISEEDRERVRALLLQQLQQRAYAEMQATMLLETEFVPPESLQVVLVHSETYGEPIGALTDQLNLSMRVTVQGVVIDERPAREAVYADLAGKVGTGYQIGSGTLSFRRGEVIHIDDERRVTFVMQAAGNVSTAIDVERVRGAVRGLSRREALLLLDRELPLEEAPRLEMLPSFWPFMPLLPARIAVVVEGQL
jgi:hypothetical protein